MQWKYREHYRSNEEGMKQNIAGASECTVKLTVTVSEQAGYTVSSFYMLRQT